MTIGRLCSGVRDSNASYARANANVAEVIRNVLMMKKGKNMRFCVAVSAFSSSMVVAVVALSLRFEKRKVFLFSVLLLIAKTATND
eukprot:11040047-Ditylum_brightwellii.AAC.1